MTHPRTPGELRLFLTFRNSLAAPTYACAASPLLNSHGSLLLSISSAFKHSKWIFRGLKRNDSSSLLQACLIIRSNKALDSEASKDIPVQRLELLTLQKAHKADGRIQPHNDPLQIDHDTDIWEGRQSIHMLDKESSKNSQTDLVAVESENKVG